MVSLIGSGYEGTGMDEWSVKQRGVLLQFESWTCFAMRSNAAGKGRRQEDGHGDLGLRQAL
jgi:hypothetical protein